MVSVSSSAAAACGGIKNGDEDDEGAASDAAVAEVTLSQTNSLDVTDGLACVTQDTEVVLENSFYRAFELADFDIARPLHIKRVTLGVFTATAGSAAPDQPAELRVYRYAGPVGAATVDLSMLSFVAATDFSIPNSTIPMTLDIPISADIDGGSFVVEVFIPNGFKAMNKLLIGVNYQGERAPGYYRAPNCSFFEPVAAGEVRGGIALVLAVVGDA